MTTAIRLESVSKFGRPVGDDNDWDTRGISFRYGGRNWKYVLHDGRFRLFEEGPGGHGIWTDAKGQSVLWFRDRPAWPERLGFIYRSEPHNLATVDPAYANVQCESYFRPADETVRELSAAMERGELREAWDRLHPRKYVAEDRTTYHKEQDY